jgi:hypothetical protein
MDVQQRNGEPLSFEKGALLVAVIFLILIVAGVVFFGFFALYSYLEHYSVKITDKAFNSKWQDYMQRMLIIGIALLLIIMAVYGFASGMVFGRSAIIIAFLVGSVFVMIVIPVEHADWVRYSDGLSFLPAFIAAILAPFFASCMAVIVSEISAKYRWKGFLLKNPYKSIAIGSAPFLVLAFILFFK